MNYKKKLFSPGDFVTTPTGEVGIVMERALYDRVHKTLPQGHRPGRYFAPGCCANPDYLTQVPVIFDDRSYDVMRAMQVKVKSDPPPQKKAALEEILESLTR